MTPLKRRTIFIVRYDEHMQDQWDIVLLCSTKKIAKEFVSEERKIARATRCNDAEKFDETHRWLISPMDFYEEDTSEGVT